MNAGGETADQVVRMSLQGIEVAANVALKAGVMTARSLAATLYAILTDKKKVKGRARLNSLLKSGKELKVFAIRHEDLKLFCQEAKRYGVLYSVLKEKNNTDGICDIMVRAEDASKISRIVDKFELATIDTRAIRESIMSQKDNSINDIPLMNDEEHDALVKSLMDSTKTKSNDVELCEANPINARTSITKENQSEHFLKKPKDIEGTNEDRQSVRKQLSRIRNQRDLKNNANTNSRGIKKRKARKER